MKPARPWQIVVALCVSTLTASAAQWGVYCLGGPCLNYETSSALNYYGNGWGVEAGAWRVLSTTTGIVVAGFYDSFSSERDLQQANAGGASVMVQLSDSRTPMPSAVLLGVGYASTALPKEERHFYAVGYEWPEDSADRAGAVFALVGLVISAPVAPHIEIAFQGAVTRPFGDGVWRAPLRAGIRWTP